jgi:hypothetical protein
VTLDIAEHVARVPLSQLHLLNNCMWLMQAGRTVAASQCQTGVLSKWLRPAQLLSALLVLGAVALCIVVAVRFVAFLHRHMLPHPGSPPM